MSGKVTQEVATGKEGMMKVLGGRSIKPEADTGSHNRNEQTLQRKTNGRRIFEYANLIYFA